MEPAHNNPYASVDLTSEIGTLGARQRGATLALPVMVRGEFRVFTSDRGTGTGDDGAEPA